MTCQAGMPELRWTIPLSLAIMIPRHGRTYPRRAIQGADFFAA
jgi:hypothetical protein